MCVMGKQVTWRSENSLTADVCNATIDTLVTRVHEYYWVRDVMFLELFGNFLCSLELLGANLSFFALSDKIRELANRIRA